MGALILSFLITVILTPLAGKLAFLMGAIDRPDPRKVHHKPIPRLGGLAIAASLLITPVLIMGLNFKMTGLMGGIVFLIVLGIIDDTSCVAPGYKLGGQLAVAIFLSLFGYYVLWVDNPFGGLFYLDGLGVIFSICWVVGMVNTINLTDGLDGLAGGVCFIGALVLLAVNAQQGRATAAVLSASLAGSCLGFLIYNFHPAKIFMGDTGSMILGFFIAATTLETIGARSSITEIIVSMITLGLPILDVFIAILRRWANGQPIMGADRGHLHHRLLDGGFTHKQAVLIIYSLTAALAMAAIQLSGFGLSYTLVLLVFGLAVLGLLGRLMVRGRFNDRLN